MLLFVIVTDFAYLHFVFFCYLLSAVPSLQNKLHELCKIHIAQQVCFNMVLLHVVLCKGL